MKRKLQIVVAIVLAVFLALLVESCITYVPGTTVWDHVKMIAMFAVLFYVICFFVSAVTVSWISRIFKRGEK